MLLHIISLPPAPSSVLQGFQGEECDLPPETNASIRHASCDFWTYCVYDLIHSLLRIRDLLSRGKETVAGSDMFTAPVLRK